MPATIQVVIPAPSRAGEISTPWQQGNFPGGDERTLGKHSGWPRVFSCERRISFVAGRRWRRTAVKRQRSVRFSRLSTRLGLATIDVFGPAFELIKHLHQRRAFSGKTIQDTSRKGSETDLHDQVALSKLGKPFRQHLRGNARQEIGQSPVAFRRILQMPQDEGVPPMPEKCEPIFDGALVRSARAWRIEDYRRRR